MNQRPEVRGRRSGAARVLLVVLLMLLASPVFADSKDENLKPLDGNKTEKTETPPTSKPADTATDADLEAKYRAELEKRLTQERESYEGSLRSLWLSNSAVWAALLGFIIFQAIGIRKRTAELARLKAQRESGDS